MADSPRLPGATAPPLTEANFLTSLQAYLPRGRAWPRDPERLSTQLLSGLAKSYARIHARCLQLLVDAFPATTVELLPEWEASVGLPDPCVGTLPTYRARIAAVVNRLISTGGQSVDYFIQLAASFGLQIRIEEYVPFYAGRSRAGDPCQDEQWAYAWKVIAPNNGVIWFRAGISRAGEPLAWWANVLLECIFRELKPAHTEIVFSYTLSASIWDDGETFWDAAASIWDEGLIIE